MATELEVTINSKLYSHIIMLVSCHSSDVTDLTNNSQLDKLRLVFLTARRFVSGCSRLRLISAILLQLLIFAAIDVCILLL